MARLCLLAAVVVAVVLTAVVLLCPAAPPKNNIIYVDDIDSWRAEVWLGAANPGGVIQGPRSQVAGGVGLCFLPNGEAFQIGSGVILLVPRKGPVRYLAGSPDMPGCQDGPASQALLGRQLSGCVDGKGNLVIGDRTNRSVRRLFPRDGRWFVETLAGDPTKEPWKGRPADGQARTVSFRYMHSNVAIDAAGAVYVFDDNFLRRVTADGRVETLNPSGGEGPPAAAGDEPLASARFRLIMGGAIGFGGDGRLYVADRWNHCVRRIDLAAGRVSVAVGPGSGYRDGPEREAGYHDSPGSVVFDPWRNRFYINGVDDNGLRVWEKGEVRTIAGGPAATGFEGPARDSVVVWTHVSAVDPLPPHAIYFHSGGGRWAGRTGRLVQVAATQPEVRQ